MPNGVKIELGRGGSVGIFLEDADGVVGEGGNAAVLPEEERPFNCFMENYIKDRHESEAGQSSLRRCSWFCVGRLVFGATSTALHRVQTPAAVRVLMKSTR